MKRTKKWICVLLSAVMLFSVLSVFQAFAAGTVVTVNALYGKIENYKTTNGLRTYFIVGFSQNADEIVKAIFYDRLRFEITVKDETSGSAQTFEYHSRNADEVYDTENWDFARIPVCEYGVYPDPEHAYTLSFIAYDGQTPVYRGTSAAGAFVSTNEDFLANGPVIPDLSGVTVDHSSPLAGKSLLFVGDSITEAICEVNIPEKAYTAGWPGRVGVSNAARYMNLGRSGATVSNNRGSNQVLNQLKSVDGRAFDMVVIHGGTNDAWFLAPLGSVTANDIVTEGSFDVTTFAGGLEETFRYAKEHFPGARICYIINHTMPLCEEGNTSDMHDLFELAKDVCRKWNVPYLDLYNNEELNVNRMKTSTRFTLGDDYKAHPNDRGYDILFPYVDQFLKAVWQGEDPLSLTDPPYTPLPDYTVTGKSNVAYGKTARTLEGADASKVTDGKTNAYVYPGDWADDLRGKAYGTDGKCGVEIDLGAVYDLDAINVVNFVGNLVYKWEAYVSLDNSAEISSWTKVGEKTSFEMSYIDGCTVNFEPTSARYVRIYGTYHNANKVWVINEVSAYGVLNEEATLEGQTVTPAEFSSRLPAGDPTNKLTDGNKTSDPAVTGVVEGGSVTVDLGSEKTLSSVSVYTYENNSSYTLLGSKDGVNFEIIGQKPLGGASYTAENGHEYTFSTGASCRYLRVLWAESERSDGYVALAEVEARDASGNLIEGCTAEAVNSVNAASNAVDGKKTTYTFINAPKTGFILDLGQTRNVRMVKIWPQDPDLSFTVSTSLNNSSFTSFAAYDGSGLKEIILFGQAEARYVNILPANYKDGAFGLYEVEIYTSENGQDDPDVDLSQLSNASLGKKATLYTATQKDREAFSLVDAPAVTDGKMNDVWAYGAFGEMYAEIDLEIVYEISAVNLRTYYSDAYGPLVHAWSVYVSEDGETFTNAASVARTGHDASGVTVTFEKTNARYVRVVPDYYVTDKQFSFNEITVYGTVPAVPLDKTGISSVTLPDGGDGSWLFNGDFEDTRAIDGASGGFVTFDLKSSVAVTKIAEYTYENNSAYMVFGSNDATGWTPLGFKALDSVSNTANGWEYILDVSGSYRYIRVQWAASGRPDGYLTVKEVDIFNGAAEYNDVAITNVKTVYVNNNSNDGNYSNYTFYKKADGAVTVDLGTVKDVRKIEFFSNASAVFTVERSADGENFTEFGKVTRFENGAATLEIPYSATRYLRLVGISGSTFDLAEIAVYTPSELKKGDVNADGNVNIDDVTALLDFLSGRKDLPAGSDAADLNASGGADISDVSELLNLLAGKN